MTAEPVLVPIARVGGRLDNDSPTYVFAPDLYLTLALCYDSLAAPDVLLDSAGVRSPDFTRMQPRLATSWQEETTGDWVIELREGIYSQLGNELTADDLRWTFDKAFAHGVMAEWRWRSVVGVEEVEVLDQYRLRFRLRAPYPTFPNWLLSASPNLVDATAVRAHATEADPWGLEWLDANASGYGAYRLESFSEDGLRFRARDDHWLPKAEASEIEAIPWRDRTDAIAQLDESRPVVIAGIDPDETTALLARDDLDVVRTWAGHVSVEIDFTQAPFDDQRVRHALAFATPYAQLREDGLRGLARPWTSPVKGISQWYLQDPLPYRHDPARARELLAAAGHGDGLVVDLFIQAKPYCARMAEIIAAAWAEAGVEVTVRSEGEVPPGWLPSLFLRSECAHNTSEPIYDLAHDYAAMTPIRPLPGGAPHVGNWTPRWKKNPEVLEQFVAMLDETDAAAKRTRFDDLQRHLVDFGSSIFIGEMQQVLVANEAVPRSLLAPDSRLFHALAYQNATTNYLPVHRG